MLFCSCNENKHGSFCLSEEYCITIISFKMKMLKAYFQDSDKKKCLLIKSTKIIACTFSEYEQYLSIFYDL